MIEFGKITAVKGEFATVCVDKKDECSKCGMCLFSNNANFTEFSAMNGIGAKIGDTVEIEKKENLKLLSVILVFFIPLLLIGLSCAVTFLFLENELWTLLLSVISILLWYTILAFIDKKLKNLKGFSTVITRIVNREDDISGDNRDNRDGGV